VLQRQFAHWQKRLLHNLHNEWAHRGIAKAEGDTPLWHWVDDVVDDAIDQPSTSSMRETAEAMAAAYIGSAGHTVREANLEDPDPMLLRINTEAVNYAASRGAEMVGRRYDADGRLVDNPDADWAITDTNRGVLAREIRDAVALHWDVDKLADRLGDTGLFSDYRAEMIARTETNMAQSQGVLAAGREAEAAGFRVQKVWTLGPNPCPLCEDAAAEGAIDLEEDFGSDAGDAPPLHPNCECSLDLFVSDDEQRQEDEEDAHEAIDAEDEIEGYDPGLETPVEGDNDLRKQVIGEWADQSPWQTKDDIDDLVETAPHDQRLLLQVGNIIARDLDVEMKTQGFGPKTQNQKGIDRVLDKTENKYKGRLSKVSDVTRITLLVDEPQQANQAVAKLGEYFETISEEWKTTPVLYTDRAVNIRLPDGMIGEVQIMDQQMADAKEVGHKWFKVMQAEEKAGHMYSDAWCKAYDDSRELYGKVLDNYSDEWKAVLPDRPPRVEECD
jgi:hypothetical protein